MVCRCSASSAVGVAASVAFAVAIAVVTARQFYKLLQSYMAHSARFADSQQMLSIGVFIVKL